MKVGNFAKGCTVAATAAMLAAGLIAAPAAMADPASTPAVTTATITGFGSDTTQDVMNEVAKSINTLKGSAWIANYDTLGADTVVAKPGGAAVPRANGSGEGFKLLQVAKGILGSSAIVSGSKKAAVTTTTLEAAGQVDFARSSSNGSGSNASGIWSYVPFAKDALAMAVNPASATNGMASLASVLTVGASGDTATTASVYSIYHCMARYVHTTAAGAYVGVSGTSTPVTVNGVTSTKSTLIKPVIPAYGSGTRSYFVKSVAGYSSDSATLIDPTSADTSCLIESFGGQDINEHDGIAIKGLGAGAIAPYSIPQWVAQSKSATTGVKDRRNGTILLGMAGVAATTGTGASLVTNTAFPVKRVMFNVLPYGKLSDSSSREYALFNGQDSLVCQATSSITKMGFIPLNLTATPASIEDCGYTGNRYGTSTVAAPASISAEFAQVKTGDTFDITVDGNQEAGTADFAEAADYTTSIGTATVAANDFRGTLAVTTAAAAGATLSYKGKFTPTDTSVFTASAQSAAVSVKVIDPYTVTLNDIPARAKTGAKLAVKATVAPAQANGGALVGGWVTLVDAAGTELSSTYLPKRATVADLEWTATAGVTTLAVRFDPENSSPSLVATSASQDVTVATGATSFTTATGTNFALKAGYLGKISKASALVPKITIKLAKAGTLTPTGTVKVLISTGKTGGTALTLTPVSIAADGTAVIVLPKAAKWRQTTSAAGVDRYLNVVYSGDSNFYSVTKSLKVSLTN